jgi:alpha-methylacyl-CoA racemase
VSELSWPPRSTSGPWRAGMSRTCALEGLRVLDFSSLLPGPFASLLLAQAGATVIKVERPNHGDGLRKHPHDFAMLNAGKQSLTADLKDARDREHVWALAETADVIVEQFRPGVMDRLGFGFDALAARNPAVVYCSITGYGQSGQRSTVAGHDLNYVGHSGMLSLLDRGTEVGAALPPGLIADVGGGSYPAFMNIILALLSRTAESAPVHLDVAMADNVFPFMYWALARDAAAIRPGGGRLTGASPRYNTYPTRDDRMLLVAALEPPFWSRFCAAIQLAEELRDDSADPRRVIGAVAAIVRQRDAAEWTEVLAPWDCSCSIAATVEEAWQDPVFRERETLLPTTTPSMPSPLSRALRSGALTPAPPLGGGS